MVKIPATLEGCPRSAVARRGPQHQHHADLRGRATTRSIEPYLAALEKRQKAGETLDGALGRVVLRQPRRHESRQDAGGQARRRPGQRAARRAARQGGDRQRGARVRALREALRRRALRARCARPAPTCSARCGPARAPRIPNYRDVFYAEALIGPDTVDTMPPATIDAFRDHGVVAGDTSRLTTRPRTAGAARRGGHRHRRCHPAAAGRRRRLVRQLVRRSHPRHRREDRSMSSECQAAAIDTGTADLGRRSTHRAARRLSPSGSGTAIPTSGSRAMPAKPR